MLIVARLLHVLLGVFWAGTMIFNALFLAPAIGEAGPDGAKVMGGIIRRQFMVVMPLVALVVIASGLWLYAHASGGFNADWSRSRPGMAYGLGGLLAIVTFGIGLGVVRPAMTRIAGLAAAAAQETDPARRDAVMRDLGGLRRRATAAGRAVALLLAIVAALMAVARYL